jgi:hypothetical protein
MIHPKQCPFVAIFAMSGWIAYECSLPLRDHRNLSPLAEADDNSCWQSGKG